MIENPTAIVRYQLDNHLGSASLELDENADIISYEEYHPFGTTSYRSGRSETETSQKRYKYVGKERDEETGLYYYGFRYYAAWICRFVSVDPLQFDYPHYNPFQYAGNKPISYIDLDGLEEAISDNKIDPVDNPRIRNNRASNLDVPNRVRLDGTTYTHTGFDYVAPVGTNIKSINFGKVVNVYDNSKGGDYGMSVMIAHYKIVQKVREVSVLNEFGETEQALQIYDKKEIAYYSFYSHLSSTAVEVGDNVNQGTIIGQSGMTGNAYTTDVSQQHLHFETSTEVYTSSRGQMIPTRSSRFSPNKVVATEFYKYGNGNSGTSSVFSVNKSGDSKLIKYWPYKYGENKNMTNFKVLSPPKNTAKFLWYLSSDYNPTHGDEPFK
ncbi:RHS repeat-associated core domain-containing protein [Marinifilum fragile]|uniref:RHS repeat-associated core domain-containing protein n=1 Tax=Marinifilum fragile TaxID=570161 RepID=UPI002AA670A0|nr:RHS repeat-associated core domain-containing protein [Marinifilum fragile]